MKPARRLGGLFSSPAHEWTIIAAEPADIGSLYSRHIMFFAAIPPVAILTGLAISGGRYLGATAIVTSITAAMMTYAMGLALPLAVALAVASMAPAFKSDGGTIEALKLVAYASTPIWLAGISYAFVAWSRLDVVGVLYALYLFFGGLNPVMGTPLEQRVPLTVVAVSATIAIGLALSWLVTFVQIPHFALMP